MSKLSTLQYYVYFTMRDLEVDTLFKNAEYPVLFAMNKAKLFQFNPNLLETLIEWSVRDKRTTIHYFGMKTQKSSKKHNTLNFFLNSQQLLFQY
jgi:hypothetical protein